jgi:RHS repeat-associated protein
VSFPAFSGPDTYGTVPPDNASLAVANLLGYTGAPTDISSGNATGYTHNGNRWYDTATGAFTTQDTSTYLANPANGNRYAYAADNPTNYIDPTGRTCLGDALLAIAGVFAFGAGIFLLPETFGGSLAIIGLGAGSSGATVNAAGSCLGFPW